jgi:hypothetical protein
MQTHALADPLPPAPPRATTPTGTPAYGTYAGVIPHVAWDGLTGAHVKPAWWRKLHQKRWQYVGLASPECFIGLAIADVGWTATTFAYCFDREQQAVIDGFSDIGLPGLAAVVGGSPGDGALSWFTSWRGRIRFERRPGSSCYRLQVHHQDLTVDAEIDTNGAPPFLAAVLPIAGGIANCTHKSGPLAVRGHAQTRSRTYDLSAATASLDHTIGLLGRETAWRWASAHRPGLGFNLQAGFNGDGENALWLDGELIRLGPAVFDCDPTDPQRPWRIRTADGLLDVAFQPQGARREDTNLLLAKSRYVQPIGTFSGTLRRSPEEAGQSFSDLLGVTEDHFALW